MINTRFAKFVKEPHIFKESEEVFIVQSWTQHVHFWTALLFLKCVLEVKCSDNQLFAKFGMNLDETLLEYRIHQNNINAQTKFITDLSSIET